MMGTPVANKLMDLAGYFLIVVSAIYLGKYLLTNFWRADFQMAYSVINARVGSIFWKQKGALLEK